MRLGAFLTLSCLWMNAVVGLTPGLESLPWNLRTVVVVTLDFLVPATVLGMIGPVVAKMAVEQARQAGSAIGDVYFWGAVGSIAGTFLAGFILIYLAPTSTIVDAGRRGPGAAGRGHDRRPRAGPRRPGWRRRLLGARARSPRWSADPVAAAITLGSVPINSAGAGRPRPDGGPGGRRDLGSRCMAGRAPAEDGRGRTATAEPSRRRRLDAGAARAWPTWRCSSFVASLAFMALEMVAGRLVTRHLGSSIYGWTSVIGVLLGGLSLGNFLGGKIADHIHSEKQASWLFLAASVLTLSILLLETPADVARSSTGSATTTRSSARRSP